MAVEVKTVRRVYLRPGIAPNSMFHTLMATLPGKQETPPGTDQPIVTLTFRAGVAENVEQTLYDLFAGLGYATTERPRRQWEDEEDR